jgi:hypothetical protein
MLAVIAWTVIILGCMSISIGGRHVTTGHHEDGAFVQEGKVQLGPGCEQDVFYPIPYACPPNLQIDRGCHHCVLVLQKEDRFRICNPGVFARTVEWTARGVRAMPPPPVVPVPATPALPPPTPVPNGE